MLHWSLLAGSPLTLTLQVLGVLAFAVLCLRRGRGWLARGLPACLAAGALLTAAAYTVTVWWWKPVPDAIPPVVWFGVGGAATGMALLVGRVAALRGRWPTRVVKALGLAGALLLVAAASGQTVNTHFGQYPDLRSALGVKPHYEVDLAKIPRTVETVTGTPLEEAWLANPASRKVPSEGVVAEVPIPGTTSGFPARPGMVYLPPAYLVEPRPLLPVLVLVAGQPGKPRDWIDGGMLASRMNRYAADHHGLAPVVVIPDNLGDPSHNPMCLDSRLGNAATYLQVDVPAWAGQHLQVDMAPSAWAFGGLSNGGTCALQMAVTDPGRYPTFVSLSGEDEPRTGPRDQTVQAAFGGDSAAFTKVNPLDILASRQFPDTAGFIVVGDGDNEFRPQGERVYHACQAAGMDVQLHELPGGHSWQVWGPGLELALPWLGSRQHLTR